MDDENVITLGNGEQIVLGDKKDKEYVLSETKVIIGDILNGDADYDATLVTSMLKEVHADTRTNISVLFRYVSRYVNKTIAGMKKQTKEGFTFGINSRTNRG